MLLLESLVRLLLMISLFVMSLSDARGALVPMVIIIILILKLDCMELMRGGLLLVVDHFCLLRIIILLMLALIISVVSRIKLIGV